jgi:hypothetical protein
LTSPGPHSWGFRYAPISIGGGDEGAPAFDLVVATVDDVDPAMIVEILSSHMESVEVTSLFAGHPVFWTRIQSSEPIDRGTLTQRLTAAGIEVRYTAAARCGNQWLAPPLDVSAARPRRATNWGTRESSIGEEPQTAWRWFMGPNGADVSRPLCGTGAGTRLAIIDNDGRDLDRSDLDGEVMVGVRTIPRAGAHASLLVGWAVGSRADNGRLFRGVAPDASPRLYCIPKAGDEIVSLPLAIVKAVEDGADVIVCATYVEGQTSMLLDDALEFAARLGRMGRGTLVVMPTGREMASPSHSIHSSLSLAVSDPAGDPRVFCVGPSARDGGWFLWRDRHGKLRPFANRGPSVRWLAPGDDMAAPLAADDRPAHAESSGASAIAAGVLLLLLEQNPTLTLSEVDRVLVETSTPIDPAQRSAEADLGDPCDLEPLGRDADGHNAKHGYGRLSATAACLTARDPIAATLVSIGERTTAARYVQALRSMTCRPYGERLALWSVRLLLGDAVLMQAFRSMIRFCRLAFQSREASLSRSHGQVIRQLGIIVRLLIQDGPPSEHREELMQLDARLRALLCDAPAAAVAETTLHQFVSTLATCNEMVELRTASVTERSIGARANVS